MHNDTKGGICIKIEFNPQKNISLLQDARRFFIDSSNMAAYFSIFTVASIDDDPTNLVEIGIEAATVIQRHNFHLKSFDQ